MKRLLIVLFSVLFFGVSSFSQTVPESDRVVVAYVTSWSNVIPDPFCMTHLNYAFGHVNDTFDGVRVDNPDRLKTMVELKKLNPELKVMLSVGGWGSGRFSEMAADKKCRRSFAEDCLRVVEEYGLDGIDIDWEYPTSSAADISSSPDDTKNFTKLMKDLRKVLGQDRLLTLASAASAEYIDFKAIEPYMDFVNIMAYDMANAPKHHSALYESENSGSITSDKAVKAHIAAGFPAHKLVLGMPFYGRGGLKISSFNDYKDLHRHTGVVEKWDEKAMVPYLEDEEGVLQLGYENPRSLRIKCEYVKENGLKGAMYWDYDGDNEDGDLRKTVAENILGKKYAATRSANYAGKRVRFKALLYHSENVEEAHAQFAHQTIEFFKKLTYGEGYSLEVTTDMSAYPYEKLKEYDVLIMPNAAPWSPSERAAFEEYMKNGGGWVGFHAAAYNDRNTNWPWLLEFLGGGVFLCNNWPPQPVLLEVDTQDHSVTRNLPKEFVAPASEWYQWAPSPRECADIQVLVSLSEKNYPLGIKDIVYSGDWPVVWTNKNYRMIYLNMGHGDEEYIDATQNLLFTNAFRWVVSQDPDGDPFNR